MSILTIGFTGTRKSMTEAQQLVICSLLMGFKPARVLHGDCIGADLQFACTAKEMTPKPIIESFPGSVIFRANGPADIVHDVEPPLTRNIKIIEQCNMLIACPRTKQEERRSWTWATIRQARIRNRLTLIIWPDGTSTLEGL